MNNVARIVVLGGLVAFGAAYATGQFNTWLPQEMKVGGSTASVLGDGEAALQPQDAQLEEKLQPVISCLNDVASPLSHHAEAYVNEYPHLAQTPGATRIAASFKIQVYEQNNSISRGCIDGLRGAVAMAPADAGLDDPGKVFADTLEKLIPVMNETDTYYSRKDNVDDHMEKGKLLDGQLMPLFNALFDAEGKLRQVVSERNHTLREKRLAAIEQAFGTENFGWQTLNVSLSARRAIDGMSSLAESGKLDAQSVEKIEQDYQAAFDKADAFAKAHPDVKTKLGNNPKWFSLSSDFNGFLAELKEVRRLLAGNPDQQAVQPLLAKLQASYNSLIRTYNMIPDA